AGHLPLWNSLNGMGAPLAANYQSALFYPPTWLLLPFYLMGGAGGLAMGETWSVVLHLIWPGIGMVFLMRKLGCGKFAQAVAALAFSLSGYLVTRATFLSINVAVAWLPWVILAAEYLTGERKPGLKAILGSSLIIGLLLLAGHAQTAFYTLLLAGCWVLFRQSCFGWKSTGKVVFTWGLSVLLGCGLAAIQLIPTAEYLMQSQRAAEIGYDYAVNYSFLPWRFLTTLMPNLFGTPADGTYLLKADAYWEDAIYIGLLPLILGLGALILAIWMKHSDDSLRIRGMTIFLAVVSVIATLIALGSNTPIFPFLYNHVPTFDLFQAPARWMIWFVFAFSVMAGIGTEAWHQPGKWGRFWLNLTLALGATMTVVALLAGYLVPEIPGVFIKAFTIFGISIVLGCILAKTNPLPSEKEGSRVSIWRWAVVLFVSLDLLLASWGFHQGADPSLYEKATAAAKEIKAQADGGRIYISSDDLQQLQYDTFFDFRDFRMDGKWDALANAVLPNTNLYGGLSSLNNFDPLIPRLYNQLLTWLDFDDEEDHSDLLHYVGLTLVEIVEGEGGRSQFESFSGCLRFRWADCQLYVRADCLREMAPGSTEQSFNKEAEIVVIEERPDKLTLRVVTPAHGWLTVYDLYYPGWQVQVDDRAAKLERIEIFFRGVELEAGEHIVFLNYQPPSFFIGFVITLGSLILMVVLWIRIRKSG
ncbi:MAG: YfhO family protein, partial [Anaerolineaceae bacterium]|nr:YfhO family protein [Anaerolineaceae bacterium]